VRLLGLVLAVALLTPRQDPIVDAPRPFNEWLQELMTEARERR